MKKIFFCIIAAFMMPNLFASCTDNDKDTTRPVISIKAPAAGEQIWIGDSHGLHFVAEFSDDVMLGSYKIEIHNNFDGHGHTREADGTVPFSYSNTWDLSGRKEASIHHHDINIPDNTTPGQYHFIVYCLDAAGNESHAAIDIELAVFGLR